MKQVTLTKKEFIERSMKGEVFIDEDRNIYFYDETKMSPFRSNEEPLVGAWFVFDGGRLFTLEEPEPIIERRWVWLKDLKGGFTSTSTYYYSDEYAIRNNFAQNGWYKSDMYIDVEIKQ